jgi:hypothetical protein
MNPYHERPAGIVSTATERSFFKKELRVGARPMIFIPEPGGSRRTRDAARRAALEETSHEQLL